MNKFDSVSWFLLFLARGTSNHPTESTSELPGVDMPVDKA